MNIFKCLKLSLKNLSGSKLRSFLTIFSTSIGVMLIVIVLSLTNGISNLIDANLKQFSSLVNYINVNSTEAGTDNKAQLVVAGNTTTIKKPEAKFKKIDDETINKIKGYENVSLVVPVVQSNVSEIKIDDKTFSNAKLIGVEKNQKLFTDIMKDSVSGDTNRKNKDTTEAILAGTNSLDGGILISQSHLDEMGIKDYKSVIGKEITLKTMLPISPEENKENSITRKINGVTNDDYSIYGGSLITSKDDALAIQEFYSDNKNYFNDKGYSTIIVECKSLKDVKVINDNIKTLGYSTESMVDITEQINSIINIVKLILTSAAMIVLIVSSFGLVNTMNMNILEKRKSIGVMKAVGASKSSIATIFTLDAALLGLFGGLLGTLFAIINSSIVNQVLKTTLLKGSEISQSLFFVKFQDILLSVGISLLISIFAGFIPSRKAANLDTVEILSYE